MYQKLIASAVVTALLCGCDGKKETAFELKGKFTEGSDGDVIYLEKLINPKPVVVDSTTIDAEGNFSFSGYSPKIGFYRIKTTEQNFAMLVLDSADKVTVTGNLKDLGNTYKVEGSEETRTFMDFQQIIKNNRFQQDSLNQAFQMAMTTLKMDSLRMDSLSKVFQPPYEAIMKRNSVLVAEKVRTSTNMYASLMALQELPPDEYADLYKKVDESLTKKYPNDRTVMEMHSVITRLLSTLSGVEAPEIKLPTPEGKELALSSLRGKIVLIDFWASWCVPCRKEMPSVVKLYEKYKNKGFEIFGVSLDSERDAWVEAIKKDGITWPQVSELKRWESETPKIYGVQGIPYTVLVDKEGKIIAKGLRGQELEKALENIMAGKDPEGNPM